MDEYCIIQRSEVFEAKNRIHMLNKETLFFSIFLYLLSVLLAIGANKNEAKVSLPLSKIAYLAGTVIAGFVLFASVSDQGWAIRSFYEGILFSLVVLGFLYFVGQFKLNFAYTPALLSVLSLILSVLAFVRSGDMPQDSTTTALASHTYCMFIALTAFSLSFIFSLLFLFQEGVLRKKKLNPLFLGLPALELTHKLNFLFITIGTSSFLVGVVGGMTHWQESQLGQALWRQPSVLLSFLMLFVYIGILVLRINPLNRARSVAFSSIVCYFLLLLVFFGAHL